MNHCCKIKRHSLIYIICCCCLLFFSLRAVSQRVGRIKVTEANAAAYRDSLKIKVFGSTFFPYDILPDSVNSNVNTLFNYPGTPYSTITYPSGNLDSIDEIVIKVDDNIVDFPEQVRAYLFHPHNSNGKLFIYHSGHCMGIAPTEDILGNALGQEPGLVIAGLVAAGYTVLAVPMINYQFNSPVGISCGYNNHDYLFVDGHYQYPMAFFFKPLIASLNLLGRSNYAAIYMCGLSGGGWTTSIYPAIDSSVSMSFPVAGSWPTAVRNAFYAEGDYEQTDPTVFNFLDYHEIYTLACLAPARKMLQINNRYDACCFGGSEAQIFYVDSVKNALAGSNGIFKFYLDETQTGHQFSKRALQLMLTFIRNENAFLLNKPADSVTNGMNYFYDIKNNFALNVAIDNSTLKYSLLKAPAWLSLNSTSGQLSGTVPTGNIISKPDSVSFKVEDSTGRFVVCNYNIKKKRDAPYIFTKFTDSTIAYALPPFSNSIQQVNPLSANSFYLNNAQLSILGIAIENSSVIKLIFNQPLQPTDSIGYNGFAGAYPLTYTNGLRMDDFTLSPINLNIVSNNHAIAGMIRFNSDTTKFEYFNGFTWVNMN